VGIYVGSFAGVERYECCIVENDEENVRRHVIGQIARHLYIYSISIVIIIIIISSSSSN